MLGLQIKLKDGAMLPYWSDNPNRMYVHDGGLDIRANECCILLPGERGVVKTGIHTAFSPQYVALLRDRSGLAAKHGITVLAGVIDSGYRGEWSVVLLNTGKVSYHVDPGDRICQAIFVVPNHLAIEQVDELPNSERGEKGFGSSGKQ
jgi:dUTP pyrophosphatase